MNRNDWQFPYTADKLLLAAKAKHTFHTERLAWWSNKRVEVEKQIQVSGIVIDTSVAEEVGKFSYSNTGRPASVTVDNSMVRDFQECISKVDEHRKKIAEYDAWMQVLASQGQSTFNLHQDDWLFFFGKS